MSEVMCISCKGPTTYRERETIANVLHAGMMHCATQNTDWQKRFLDLLARLSWVEGELRSICANCILGQTVQAHLPPTPEEIQRRYVERTPNVSSPFLQPRLRVVHND